MDFQMYGRYDSIVSAIQLNKDTQYKCGLCLIKMVTDGKIAEFHMDLDRTGIYKFQWRYRESTTIEHLLIRDYLVLKSDGKYYGYIEPDFLRTYFPYTSGIGVGIFADINILDR